MKLKPGLMGEASMTVQVGNTAAEVGSGSVPVFSTPMLVAIMENAAINALKEHLPEGSTTVGGRIECRHRAPTPIGMTVTARAQLVEVVKNKLVFKIEAYDELEKVGEAEHDRFVIDHQGFLKQNMEKKKKWEDAM